jgi:hypothetical protein
LSPGFYESDGGAQVFRSMIKWLALVEELGFDWVSFSEPHYPARILDALMKRDSRNPAGVPRPAFRDGALPTTFVGSPDTVVKQVERCREEVRAGVIDCLFQGSDVDDPKRVTHGLELFGEEILPRIRDV